MQNTTSMHVTQYRMLNPWENAYIRIIRNKSSTLNVQSKSVRNCTHSNCNTKQNLNTWYAVIFIEKSKYRKTLRLKLWLVFNSITFSNASDTHKIIEHHTVFKHLHTVARRSSFFHFQCTKARHLISAHIGMYNAWKTS